METNAQVVNLKGSLSKRDSMILRLISDIESLEDQIKEFADKLVEEPWYALEWAGDTYRRAASLRVKKSVLALLQKQGTSDAEVWAYILETAKEQAFRGALYPERSTSPWSNEMKRELASAWARFYERYQRFTM